MKFCKEAIMLTLVAFGFGACSEENPWAKVKGKGGVELHLSADVDVKDALPSVRAGVTELEAPDVAYFSIEMKNMDSGQVQTWQKLEDFNSEEGFDVGTYTLTAFYGNINECGFDKPYFRGEETVNVLEGRESSVEVNAQLANLMLSIDYTDEFKRYFRDYSVIAHTDGHANVVFGRTESRAGFLTPGDVTLQISLTNPSGKTTTVTPAQFLGKARHHYHVTFDVNADPMGDVELSVIFDDSLAKENITFSLKDELYNAEAPVVGSEGFTSGDPVEVLSGNSSPSPLKFEMICQGGIQKAMFKIAQVSGSQTFNPSFDKELDLIQADESTQYALEMTGIKVAGLFKNPEKMAIVDVTELPRFLPEGNYEISLTVTDMAGRDNETPVMLKLSTLPISLSVKGGSAVYEYPGTAISTTPTVDATVMVSYNGFNPAECISFKNKCRTGIFKDCDIVEVKESTATRGFPDKTYIFNIKVCDVETSPLPMELYFNGNKYADFELEVIEPSFSIDADAFATFAILKVDADNAEDVPTIVNGLTLYKNGEAVDRSQVTTDLENGILTLNGLEPATAYTIGYSLTTRPNGLPESQTVSIHTETDQQILNGDFSQTEQLKIDNLLVGGEWVCATVTYKNISSIDRQIPTGWWATINPLTCNANAASKNTWFIVPSTYVENGRAVIRSVAYSLTASNPSKTGSFLSTTHYNTNVPTFSDKDKVAGELFLGSYNENRTEGKTFNSRPMSITFDYTYKPVIANDEGVVQIDVLDASGKIIATATGNFSSKDTPTERELRLSYSEFGVKAASIRLKFKSSKQTVAPVYVPSGGELSEGSFTLPITPYIHNVDANQYHAVATGSVLTIDNVKLNY